MGNIKEIFKIILVIQLLTYTLAFYGHPDAETIDFSSPSQPSRDQLIIEAAIKRGMDGEAVAELLRTKQPVVRVTTTPGGMTKKTTYKLEPDGSISSKSLISQRHSYVYNSDNIPDNIPIDELRKSPTGTVTRTFTDSDGGKVTQTIGVSKPKASTVLDEDDLSGDWFSKPFPTFPKEKPITSTGHRTITRTFTGPNGERRTVQTWSSEPEFSDPETSLTAAHQPPTNFNRRTSTNTYIKPNGEKHVIHTTSNNPDPVDFNHNPRFPSLGDINWPNVDFSSYEPSWDSPDTEDSNDGWEVVSDTELETTTKKSYPSWTPRTWEWPEFRTQPTTTTTTTAKPKFHTQPRKPLPNLDDFLRSQYGSGSNAAPATTTVKTETQTPKYLTTTIPTTTSTQRHVINIEDLPVMEILHNGKPANESILRNLPPHLKPRTQTEQVLKIENKYPIEEDIEVFTPKVEKNIRTFSKTHIGPEKPTLKDLDPQMQEVLRKAGISPDDITNIHGDTITKTRQEPDGRIITTTYKVNTVPATPVQHITPVQHHYTPPAPPTHTFNSYQPVAAPSLTQLAPLAPQLSPISEFLAKLGLTKFDITSRNGHYSKTFIDDNGEILTATFVLSSPRGVEKNEKPRPKPYK